MEINKHLVRIGLLTLSITIGVTGMSFVKAPKPTLKEIALQKQNAGGFIPVYIHPYNLLHKGVGPDPGSICSVDQASKPVKDQFGTDYFINSYFDETLPEAYFTMAEAVASQLNEGLGTTAFKAVFAKDLPMKTIKFLGREDQVVDWWQTEYDVVVNLSVTAAYYTKTVGSKFNTDFEFSAMMALNTVEQGKQALGSMGVPNDLGTLKTDMISHENCFSSLDELKENVSPPDAFASTCFDSCKDRIQKFIDKENKKYDKAKK